MIFCEFQMTASYFQTRWWFLRLTQLPPSLLSLLLLSSTCLCLSRLAIISSWHSYVIKLRTNICWWLLNLNLLYYYLSKLKLDSLSKFVATQFGREEPWNVTRKLGHALVFENTVIRKNNQMYVKPNMCQAIQDTLMCNLTAEIKNYLKFFWFSCN